MTVRIGNITFSNWISLNHEGGYTDTFIFDIHALNGLPPFRYRPLLQRLVAELNRKRPGASLWLRVDAPGEWYRMEVKLAMRRGLSIPYALTSAGVAPEFHGFSHPPRLFHSAPLPPPKATDDLPSISPDELKCLQVLVRIWKGHQDEIASLTGLSRHMICEILEALKKRGLAVHKIGRNEDDPTKADPFPLWHPTRQGTSLALRSWGAPKGIHFSRFKEVNPGKICTPHRSISRRWQAWLRSAYPRAEIWTGWSESMLPGMSVYPDALAWGRLQGYETLFWLEVGDEHKKKEAIESTTRKRMKSALRYCRRTGVRLVYAQLSPNWVRENAGWALRRLPEDAAVVMGDWRKFGILPPVEWGFLTM